MAELITVRAADPSRVALWEANADHPDGEIFVSGDGVFQVARTAEVVRRLRSGVLVEVKPSEPPPADVELVKPSKKAK